MSKSEFVFQKLKTNMIPIGIRNRSSSMSKARDRGDRPAESRTSEPETPASGASTAPSRISVVMASMAPRSAAG